MHHWITVMPHGADCSCGKQFSIWRMNHPRRTVEAYRFLNLVRANAHRHADAANRKDS